MKDCSERVVKRDRREGMEGKKIVEESKGLSKGEIEGKEEDIATGLLEGERKEGRRKQCKGIVKGLLKEERGENGGERL